MVKIDTYIFIFVILSVTFLDAQISDSIKQKNKELTRIKNEINVLEKELGNKSKKEQESLQALENLNKQQLLISRLINNYKAEENSKSRQINQTENHISKIENKILSLKGMYADYVVWLYKNRGLSILRFIFNAGSFNRALQRYKYFQLITDQNKKTLDELVTNKKELSELKSKYEKELGEKEKLVKQKTNEQSTLSDREKSRKELLSKLKSDQQLITEEIESKRRAEIAIKNLVDKLVEAERERKSRLLERRSKDNSYVPNYNYDNLSDFAQLKGNLSWPVAKGKIVRKFGENKNKRLNTVTLNYGIDIEVGADQPAYAVAEGIVSAIDWIPGYGSVLIITHRNEYRTVYGHITDIQVKEGDKVIPGTLLGNVNESLEGNILHFEIWNERNYQNPETWLVNK